MLNRGLILFLLCANAMSLAAEPVVTIDPRDWPYWRGPEGNGISRETGLPDSWSPDGENLVWKSEKLGTRSTPIVMRGKLYTLCRHAPATLDEAEKVVCVNADTGEILWEHIFNVYLSDVPDTRVGWSSVVGDPVTGNVFALGVCGYFVCLNGETGEVIWSRSLSEEFGLLTTYGGRTNFPVVYDNLAIISGVVIGWGDMAKPAHRILGLDKRNGEVVWFASTALFPEDTTYSSPFLTVINGQAQYILGCGDGRVYGFQPRTGKQIWKYDASVRGVNTAVNVVGNIVVGGHSEENPNDTKMGALFALDGSKSGDLTKTGQLWKAKEFFVGKTQPVILDERIYSIDDGGNVFTNNLKTGEKIGKAKVKIGTMGRASPVYGDGKLYCADATGRWFIFEVQEDGSLKKIHQTRLEPEINGSPIISHGKIYLPTETMMYCIGTKGPLSEPEARPAAPLESPVEKDSKVAQALVVPAESALRPGQKLQYQVLLYNSNGQYLREAAKDEVKYELVGKGKVSPEGVFEAADDSKQHAVSVNVTMGEVKGSARARVIPKFPTEFNFDDGEVPITGVGLRYRHIVIDYDLFKALKEKDRRTSQVYIYLMTQFSNVPAPAAKFDDSTPAQGWTNFRRYLGLLEKVTTLDSAKEHFEPALKTLQDEGVVESYTWNDDEKIGVQLVVKKGKRGIKGNGVMCKITTIPKGTRSQGWFGFPDDAGYVVQVDFMANKDPANRLPDVGLNSQRYRLEVMGAAQKLKAYSWFPHDRKSFEAPLAWEADVWYTMKFQVDQESRDGKSVALLRGKVWKRGSEEPAEWTIEAVDAPPNRHGSPGLAGSAKDTEIFFDNLKVTPR